MQTTIDEIIQAIILEELKKHPEGRTEKQLYKVINKKMKKIKKVLDIINKM